MTARPTQASARTRPQVRGPGRRDGAPASPALSHPRSRHTDAGQVLFGSAVTTSSASSPTRLP